MKAGPWHPRLDGVSRLLREGQLTHVSPTQPCPCLLFLWPSGNPYGVPPPHHHHALRRSCCHHQLKGHISCINRGQGGGPSSGLLQFRSQEPGLQFLWTLSLHVGPSLVSRGRERPLQLPCWPSHLFSCGDCWAIRTVDVCKVLSCPGLVLTVVLNP